MCIQSQISSVLKFCQLTLNSYFFSSFPFHTHTHLTTTTQRASYTLEAIAEDKGTPPLSRTVEVEIDVVDRSNKPPVWDQRIYGPIYVKENTAVGETVTSVKARSVCSSNKPVFWANPPRSKNEKEPIFNKTVFSVECFSCKVCMVYFLVCAFTWSRTSRPETFLKKVVKKISARFLCFVFGSYFLILQILV